MTVYTWAYPRIYLNRGRGPNRGLNPKAIKFARMARGWTQLELADFLGCSERTIGMWETGQRMPRLEYAQELAVYIRATYKMLTRGTLELPPKLKVMMERKAL